MSRHNVFFGILFFVVGAFFTFSSYAESDIPVFQFKTDAGETITNESLQGKPTLLVLWASWCSVCQRELPKVKTIYDEKKEKGLQVLAIGVRDKKANITGYVEGHPEVFTFPVVHDQGDKAATLFDIRGVPTFVLLNAKGEIAATHVGAGFQKDPAFMKLIDALSARQALSLNS